jgi:hypothetical protein
MARIVSSQQQQQQVQISRLTQQLHQLTLEHTEAQQQIKRLTDENHHLRTVIKRLEQPTDNSGSGNTRRQLLPDDLSLDSLLLSDDASLIDQNHNFLQSLHRYPTSTSTSAVDNDNDNDNDGDDDDDDDEQYTIVESPNTVVSTAFTTPLMMAASINQLDSEHSPSFSPSHYSPYQYRAPATTNDIAGQPDETDDERFARELQEQEDLQMMQLLAMNQPGAFEMAIGDSYEDLLALDDNVQRIGLTAQQLAAASTVIDLNNSAPCLGERCTICLTEYEYGDQVRTLKCQGSHTFHADCSEQHFKQSKKCPLCNTDFA